MKDEDHQMPHHPTTQVLLDLFAVAGQSNYGKESITQLEHGLQSATLAEAQHGSAALITAALLHDVGHLLHQLPEDAPEQGIDDLHEDLGATWLNQHFGPAVVDPVRLHVAAKRYLCTVEPAYQQSLSGPSLQSFRLQGGPMSSEELAQFESEPHFHDAVRLRRWDDGAKIIGLETPSLEHFAGYIDAVCEGTDSHV